LGPRYGPWDTRFPETEEYLPWLANNEFVGQSSWGCDAQLERLRGRHGDDTLKRKKIIACTLDEDIPHRISLFFEGGLTRVIGLTLLFSFGLIGL